MGFFIFNNITLKNHQKWTNTLEPQIFEKTRSINAINFNSFQRKPVNTLNWWDYKVARHSCFINNLLQDVIDYENNNKLSENEKFSRKVPAENVEAI